LIFLNTFLVARPHSLIPLGATVRAFQLSSTLVSAQASRQQAVDIPSIVCAIMVGLSHDSKAVRYAALETMHTVTVAVKTGRSGDASLVAFLTALDATRHELLADATYVRTRCGTLLSHSSDASSLNKDQRSTALQSIHPSGNTLPPYAHAALLTCIQDVMIPSILELVLPLIDLYLSITPLPSPKSNDAIDMVTSLTLLLSRYNEQTLLATPVAARGLIAAIKSRLHSMDEHSRITWVRVAAIEQLKPIFTLLTPTDQVLDHSISYMLIHKSSHIMISAHANQKWVLMYANYFV
jgi:hypothetical protein